VAVQQIQMVRAGAEAVELHRSLVLRVMEARIRSGQLQLAEVPVPLQEAVETMLRTARILEACRGIMVELPAARGARICQVDRGLS